MSARLRRVLRKGPGQGPSNPPGSPALTRLLTEYESFHRSRANELCHVFGIPFIVVGGARLLAAVSLAGIGLPWLTLAEIALAGTLLFYLRIDKGLALLMAAFLGTLVALGHTVHLGTGIALLAAGWTLQLVGHYKFEKKSPAFARNLAHLLIGPAWLATKLVRWR